MDYTECFYASTDEILQRLPEITAPGVTLIAGVYDMGMNELCLAIGRRYAETTGRGVAVFAIEPVPADPLARWNSKDFNSDMPLHFTVHTEMDTFEEIRHAVDKECNAGMIIIINPDAIQADDPVEHTLYVEQCYREIRQLSNRYDIPVLVSSPLSSRAVNGRAEHWPVKYDLTNWHLVEGALDNLILLHRDSYFDARISDDTTTMIFEKVKSIKVFNI